MAFVCLYVRVGDGAGSVSAQVGPGTEGVVILAESAFILVVVGDRKKGLGRHAAQGRFGVGGEGLCFVFNKRGSWSVLHVSSEEEAVWLALTCRMHRR